MKETPITHYFKVWPTKVIEFILFPSKIAEIFFIVPQISVGLKSEFYSEMLKFKFEYNVEIAGSLQAVDYIDESFNKKLQFTPHTCTEF